MIPVTHAAIHSGPWWSIFDASYGGYGKPSFRPPPMGDARDEDREILGRLAAGDLAALEELYDRYRTLTYSIAYRITGDHDLAEDVLQEAFLGVWRKASTYVEGRASVKTWLVSIVHHRAIDVVRRRRPTVDLPAAEGPAPSQLTQPDLWEDVSAGLDRDQVRAALGTIAHAQREAIELAYFGGLTQQEIAERTETPLGTVKSRMRLGLLAMRRALVDEAGGAP
jgi:RNA polymerase sigma-70 factor (ECF subfamily)